MSANTISRIIVSVSRWSSTGNPAARPDSCPTLPMSLRALSKYCDTTAHSKQISQSGALNQTIPPPHSLLSKRGATVKSP